ncbi:GDP/GTP exchange factor Sec2p [Histoplasma ohiense]|nr:GDP/GTP exchange factor Sec2p [Histoplasma ohiense (nom. inval.)]
MAELISIHGWGYPALRTSSTSNDPVQKLRANSADVRSISPNRKIPKSKSTNALADIIAASGVHEVSRAALEGPSEHSLSTLRDPRVASTSDLSTSASSPHHPDLSSEVANLSDKLIQALNSQTILDDNLAATRQELEQALIKIGQLEEQTRQYEADITNGVLMRRVDVETEWAKLKDEAAEQRTQRATIEKEKKAIELELENLTAALFEEANKMVAAAQLEREIVERRNEQLRAQIKDNEILLASQQEQLSELKVVIQNMNTDQDEIRSRTDASTAPSSPGTTHQHVSTIDRLLEAMNLTPTAPGSGEICPAPSTSYSHLMKPVCRTDIQSFEDFRAMIHGARSSKPSSRIGSGSYGGLNVMGFGNFTGSKESEHKHSYSNGSAMSLPGFPGSPNSNSPPRESHAAVLKESRFYKRALAEDIEPTLRLDAAPGISWLTRRTVLSSICEGALVVEYIPAVAAKYSFPCSLCGEARKGGENARTHRFRTSDNENAQRYPMCTICLERLRSCCDFVGYLRLIVDGHVRILDEEDEKEAWEETIRLRERMFWARIGGGVVPAFLQSKCPDKDSSSPSIDTAYQKCEDKTVSVEDPFAPDLNAVADCTSQVRMNAFQARESDGPDEINNPDSGIGIGLTNFPTNANENELPVQKLSLSEPTAKANIDTKIFQLHESDSSRPMAPSNNSAGLDPQLKVTMPNKTEL